MKPYTTIGIILIVIGIVAFAYQGSTYWSWETKEAERFDTRNER